MIKPRSKSEWITPAACGAKRPLRIVQPRTSTFPKVKKWIRPNVWYPIFSTRFRTDLWVGFSFKYVSS